MQYRLLRGFSAAATAFLLALTAHSAQAMTVKYLIGDYSSGGYSASYVHAATGCSGGYCMSGAAVKISGELTIDFGNPAASTGSASGTGDFGKGDALWNITFTSVDLDPTSVTFTGGLPLLLAIDYEIAGNGQSSSGTAYFADRPFGSGGPNQLDHTRFILWGNNWVNTDGSLTAMPDDWALGMDLYGVAVPEPGTWLLLAVGLLALGLQRTRSYGARRD